MFSDERVIQFIKENFVACDVNITDSGFPSHIKALQFVEKEFKKEENWKHEFGFALSVVIGATSSRIDFPVGFSFEMDDQTKEFWTKVNFNPEKYLIFLVESLDRYRRAHELTNSVLGWLRPLEMTKKYQQLQQDIAQSLRHLSPQ